MRCWWLLRNQDQEPRRGLLRHVLEKACGPAAWDSFEDRATANLDVPKSVVTVLNIWRLQDTGNVLPKICQVRKSHRLADRQSGQAGV